MGKEAGGDETAYEEEKDYSNHIVKHGTVQEERDSLCGKLCFFSVYFADPVFDAAVRDHSVRSAYESGFYAGSDRDCTVFGGTACRFSD